MRKDAVDAFLTTLDEGLAKLPRPEQERVLRDGAELLDALRKRSAKPAAHAKLPEEKLGRTRAAR